MYISLISSVTQANKSFLFRSLKKTIWVVNALKRQSPKNWWFSTQFSREIATCFDFNGELKTLKIKETFTPHRFGESVNVTNCRRPDQIVPEDK